MINKWLFSHPRPDPERGGARHEVAKNYSIIFVILYLMIGILKLMRKPRHITVNINSVLFLCLCDLVAEYLQLINLFDFYLNA